MRRGAPRRVLTEGAPGERRGAGMSECEEARRDVFLPKTRPAFDAGLGCRNAERRAATCSYRGRVWRATRERGGSRNGARALRSVELGGASSEMPNLKEG